MMAGSPCRYYRLTDLLRLAFSAYDDTVDVQQGSLDREHNPVAESAHIDRWSCCVVQAPPVLQCFGPAV